MLEINYPISGDLRPILLILEWCYGFICTEIGIMLSVKYFEVREKRNVQDLGYSALCFGLAIFWYFQISSDYYILGTQTFTLGIWDAINLGTFIWNIGFIGVIVGGFLFITLIERHLTYLRKYLFTAIYIVCIGVFIVLFLWNVTIARMYSSVVGALIMVFWFVFIWDLTKKVWNKPGYKYIAFKFLGSVAVFGIGCSFTVDFGIGNPILELRLLGICMLLGSFLVLCIMLLRFPPVALLEWKKSLEELFLINKSGICLVQKTFGTHARVLNDSITTSAITMVNMLIKEMVASGEQGLIKVKRKNKVIFIQSSALVNGAVISNEDNPAIASKLKQLVLKFEDIYGGFVQNWNGDGSVFQPVETIVEEIFSD